MDPETIALIVLEVLKAINFYNAKLTVAQAQQNAQELFAILHLFASHLPASAAVKP